MDGESRSVTFGGRARERRLLQRLLITHRETGRGALVLVGAGAGMGKTALLERFAEDAPGVQLVRVRCVGDPQPFAPLLELERALQASARAGESAVPKGAAALRNLHREEATRAGRLCLRPAALRARYAAHLERLLDVFATVPTALDRPARAVLFEDLHAADDDTLIALQRLTLPPRNVRALVFGTYREGAEPVELTRLVMRTESLSGRDAKFVHLRLGPLDTEETIALLAARYPGIEASREAVRALIERSEGHPERIERAVEALLASGALKAGKKGWALGDVDPELGRAPVGPPRRLAELPSEARTTLRRAAVLGTRFSTRVLARAEGRDEIAVLEVFQALHDAGRALVAPRGDAFEFANADLAAGLRAELLPPLVRAYAARAATLLAADQVRVPETGLWAVHPGAIAELWEAAGEPTAAVAAHLAAAEQDELQLALASASAHLRRAKELAAHGVAPPIDRPAWTIAAEFGRLLVSRVGAGGAQLHSDESALRSEGLSTLAEALARAEATDGDIRLRARFRATLGLVLAEEAHSAGEGLNQVRRARTLLVVGGAPDDAWRHARDEADVLEGLGDLASAGKVCQAAIRHLKEGGRDIPFAELELAHALLRIARLRRRLLPDPGTAEREPQRRVAEATIEEARKAFHQINDPGGQAEALHERALLLRESALPEPGAGLSEPLLHQCLRLLEESLPLRERVGDGPGYAAARLAQARVFEELSRLDEAAAALLDAGLRRLANGERDVAELLARIDALATPAAQRARAVLAEAAQP